MEASTSKPEISEDSPIFKEEQSEITDELNTILMKQNTTCQMDQKCKKTSRINSKKTTKKMYQKKWNETVENLRKNVCPQCGKQRNKLIMQETYLDYILDEDTLREEDLQGDVSVIACKRCWEAIRHTQDVAQLEHKDTDIKLRDKDIKILRLKLDFYSDSEGDVYSDEYESDSECSEREESSSDEDDEEERTDGKDRGRSLNKKQLNHSCAAEPANAAAQETQKEKEERVFNFKNLKLNLKKKK